MFLNSTLNFLYHTWLRVFRLSHHLQLYERQQRDMCLLHLNLESTKRLLTHRDRLQLNKERHSNGETRRNRDSEPTDLETSKDQKKGGSGWEEERKQEGKLEGKGNDNVEEGWANRMLYILFH